ncbi:MerR family transcriptional regulator [Microbacterium resistens]|uniref:helix-turn-helix domain-containing protein n=1 Tax=Microbacterium resistens TaxID=156977 RepID=UPI00083782C5|nr:helix-turn-helix domain-containing protein [Microbacterium resistens]
MTATVMDSSLRLYTLRELTDAGYGSRQYLLNRIHSGELPAVRIGKYWKVRESDLAAVAGTDPAELRAAEIAAEYSDLASVAASVVATWPRLSDERRAELRLLLAIP